MIESAMWSEDGTFIRVTINGEVWSVPDDMANRHRQELEQWSMVKGNGIQPYVPVEVPAPPEVVTPLPAEPELEARVSDLETRVTVLEDEVP